MKLYQLTPVGRGIARSVNAPDNATWKVLRYFDRTPVADSEQISRGTGIQGQELASALGALRRRKCIVEVGG